MTSALQIQGKPMSYNNINDTDAAFELVAEFDQPTIAIIKHAVIHAGLQVLMFFTTRGEMR